MTDIKVTQADRDLVMAIAMLVNDTGITIPERLRSAEDLCARYRIEAQRPLLEALEEARNVILNHGEDAMALMSALVMADAAIEQAKGE